MKGQQKLGKVFIFNVGNETFNSLSELAKKTQEIQKDFSQYFTDKFPQADEITFSSDVLAGELAHVKLKKGQQPPKGFKNSPALGEGFVVLDKRTKAGKDIRSDLDKIGTVTYDDVKKVIGYDGDELFKLSYIEKSSVFAVIFDSEENVSLDNKDAVVSDMNGLKKVREGNSSVVAFLSNLSELDRQDLLLRLELSSIFRACVQKTSKEAMINDFLLDEKTFADALKGTYEFSLTDQSKLKFLLNK